MSLKIFRRSFYPFFDPQNNLRFESEPQITFRPSTALSNSAKAKTDGLRPDDSCNVFHIFSSLKARIKKARLFSKEIFLLTALSR